LAKTLTNPEAHTAIYKPEDSGFANNVRIVNNVIIGGYNAIAVAAGDTNQHGTDWRLDSNIIRNAYYHSAFIGYTDFLSVSNNLITPMSTNSYVGTGWIGLTIQ